MSDSIIELVELENGDIVLRKSDNPDKPLVTISISDQVENLLPEDRIDVVNAMVEAGIDARRIARIICNGCNNLTMKNVY